jgi:RecA/RadA recombinase
MNINDLVKATGNENAGVAENGLVSDVRSFIDTGSYCFNALLSGSIYGGLPDNKITALAGESATGKTFFALGIVHKFLSDNPDAVVLYFDTENAITSDMVREFGIDPKRIALIPIGTVEEFRHQVISVVDAYKEQTKSEKKPLLIVLDSLGMLSTNKEMADTADGKTTRDMTRAQIVKSTFRTLTLKLGQVGVPLILTNHTYDVIGSMFPQKEMGGGAGLKYAASTIIYLSKKKVKEGTDVIGNIIHCKLYKSRITKENSMVDVMLNYETGLHPYYGLVDIAIENGIFEKLGTRVQVADGSKVYEKQIYREPEKYFTAEVMTKIEACVGKKFKYGSSLVEETDETTTG